MWQFSRNDKRLPRSFYEKGMRLVEQARTESDPAIRKLLLKAASNYYGVDMNQKEPFGQTLIAVSIVYILIFAVVFYTFQSFPVYVALPLVLASYCLCALLIGATMRMAGYINEATFLGMFKAGLHALLLRTKQ
jgi:hypothetical protein